MKNTLTLLLLTLVSFTNAQQIATPNPTIGIEYNFGKEQKALWDKCISFFTSNMPEGVITEKELEKCGEFGYSEGRDGFWGITSGCGWYCGGDYTQVTASSSLKSRNKLVYSPKSISDLNYKTAWVEGVKGDGIGEFVEYTMMQYSPKITKIIIVNGYIKDKKTWQNNSRVRQLKMYLNDKLYAILNLKDVYSEQTFEVPTIDPNKSKKVDEIKIKFEISSVFKGDKYEDTAITEIYFDGNSHHH